MRNPNRSFGKVVDHLNKKPIGYTFNKYQVKEELKGLVPSTIYLYLKKLTQLKYLEQINTKPISYTIVTRIPDYLNTVVMGQIIFEIEQRPSWKDWFMDMEDRIKKIHSDMYPNER